jgi:hypothetical protein
MQVLKGNWHIPLRIKGVACEIRNLSSEMEVGIFAFNLVSSRKD